MPVTAFAIDEQMHLMAAGFADGSIVLYRGMFFQLDDFSNMAPN